PPRRSSNSAPTYGQCPCRYGQPAPLPNAAQCAGLQAGGDAPPRRAALTRHLPHGKVIKLGTAGRAGTSPRGVKACGAGARPGCLPWRSAAKQEATEVPPARHRLNLQPSGWSARQTLTYLIAASGPVVVDPGWNSEAGWQALAEGLKAAGA